MDERTIEIINRFTNSWTQTEKFYDNLINNYPEFENFRPIRKFISKLKQQGENKFFRLGTFIHDLSFSRSVDGNLRPDQKFLKIETINSNDFEVTFRDGEKIYRQYRISDLDDMRLKKLLQTLKEILAD